MSEAIGFIGLGLMGAGFCKRLIATGHPVVGYDVDAARRVQAAALGVAIAASSAEVVERTETVCLAVTTTKAVQAVVQGPGGLLAAGRDRAASLVIDFSTTEIAATRAVAHALAERGIDFVDAPVSGGPVAAETGKLAIMAGGSPEALARARPLAACFGLFTPMGPVGAGQATKLVNQALCLTGYVAVAESLRLAEAHGVDAAKIPAALAPGFANSAVLQSLMPRMIARDFAPQGYARQVLKDLEMLMEAGRERHLAMPMVAQATTLFRMLVAQGHGELDAVAVLTMLPEPTAE